MLIVALGVLTLLSLLAVSFAILMSIEQKIAVNYVDNVRATFLASAGREASVVYLRRSISDQNTLLSQDLKQRFPWLYNNGDYSLPLEKAMMMKNPASVVSFYGDLGATYPGGRDRYGSMIIDTNSQFNLNNRFMVIRLGGGRIDDPIYVRILTNLGKAISQIQGVKNPIPENKARAILEYRNQLENQRFSSKEQLIEILGKESYELVKNYVTVHSWVDHKAVLPTEEILGNDPYSTIGNIPSINYQLSERSPLNINTASLEVLTAVIAGVGGRTVFTYNDVNVEKARQLIDSQSKKWQISTSIGQKYEATDSSINSLYIWIEPFNLREAQMIAENLIEWRTKRGPFDNLEELYEAIDLMFSGRFGKDVFSKYWGRVKGIVLKRISQEVIDSGNMRNPFLERGMVEVLRNIVRKGAADCLKANFNPNADVAFFNPNTGVAKVVDKANLLYMRPGKTSAGQYGKAEVRQTLDACFTPMGIFEITTLGLVESKDRKVEAKAKIHTLVWIYDAVRHTTQADFEANSDIFGTQRMDVVTYPEPSFNWKVKGVNLYEGLSGGGIPSGASQLGADNTIIDGRVELAEAADTSARGINNASFFCKWNYKRGTNPPKSWSEENSGFSNYFAEVKAGRDERWAYAYETLDFEDDKLIRKNASVQRSEGNLMPDGFFNTMFTSEGLATLSGYRPRFIWFRAGYFDPTPKTPYVKKGSTEQIEQGEYSPDSMVGLEPNVDYYGGVFEFWYKPDKDWQRWYYVPKVGERPLSYSASYYNMGALDVFMGFLFVSHVRPKAAPDSNGKITKSTGTQLFVFRSVTGDLRATRVYYEILGEYPKAKGVTYPEQPFILRKPLSQQAVDNAKKLGGDYQKYLGDNEATGLKEYIKAYEVDPADTGGTYTWPPQEIGAITPGKLDSRILRARSDCIIHANRLIYIRAHEWHHFTVKWNDSDASAERLYIQIDNSAYLKSIPLPRVSDSEFVGTFIKLNEIPGKNRDHVYIGSIFRKQLFVRSGVFKFTRGNNIVREVCHGTIDDVYYFPLTRAGRRGIPSRFAARGRYVNAFELQDKFSGGIQSLSLAAIAWTAYLPRWWHSMGPQRVYPRLRFRFSLRQYDPVNRQLKGYRPVTPPLPPGSTDVEYTVGNFRKTGILPLVDPNTGKPYQARHNEWLVYEVEFLPGSPAGGAGVQRVVTPILDDITLIYFLPQPTVISEKTIYE